jgi:hypothetical protein
VSKSFLKDKMKKIFFTGGNYTNLIFLIQQLNIRIAVVTNRENSILIAVQNDAVLVEMSGNFTEFFENDKNQLQFDTLK